MKTSGCLFYASRIGRLSVDRRLFCMNEDAQRLRRNAEALRQLRQYLRGPVTSLNCSVGDLDRALEEASKHFADEAAKREALVTGWAEDTERP